VRNIIIITAAHKYIGLDTGSGSANRNCHTHSLRKRLERRTERQPASSIQNTECVKVSWSKNLVPVATAADAAKPISYIPGLENGFEKNLGFLGLKKT